MSEKEKFKKYFIESAYINMHIEDEAVYSKEELYNRYRYTLDSLISAGVYKDKKYKSLENV